MNIIVYFGMNSNIFELAQNLLTFAFSHCVISHKNFFKLYLIYNNTYQLLFPAKDDEDTMIINLDYLKIRDTIIERLNVFFENYQKHKEIIEQTIVLNKIFKKILLEINKNVVDNISVNSQILIVTDVFAEYEIIYDQKLVFLLKKLKIIIDCLHISDSINYYIQSIANYSGGLYETINTAKLMQQKLLQSFLTFPQERKIMKSPLTNLINKPFICSNCKGDIYKIEIYGKNVNCVKCSKELIGENNNNCIIKK